MISQLLAARELDPRLEQLMPMLGYGNSNKTAVTKTYKKPYETHNHINHHQQFILLRLTIIIQPFLISYEPLTAEVSIIPKYGSINQSSRSSWGK